MAILTKLQLLEHHTQNVEWSEKYGDENTECKSCDSASYLGHFGQVNQSGYVSSPVKGDNAYVTKP